MRDLKALLEARENVGAVGSLDFLISRASGDDGQPVINYKPFRTKEVEVPEDLTNYMKPPSSFPEGIKLPPLVGVGNDYTHLKKLVEKHNCAELPDISVIVLTYNRDAQLRKTLIALTNQQYPTNRFEVIVTDDGGRSSAQQVVQEFCDSLNVRYCWHPDKGFTPGEARNNAIRMARNDLIVQLDVDMYPDPQLLESYARYERIIDRAALIGPRRYVDISDVNDAELASKPFLIRNLPEIKSQNKVASVDEGGISKDWRLEIFKKTQDLKSEPVPFRVFAAGNVAFSRRRFLEVGCYDPRFDEWGHEDGELAFRMYNKGLYFLPVYEALAYHQEPVEDEHKTDRLTGQKRTRKLYAELCPFYRRFTTKGPPHEVPLVSIYIPAFNAEKTVCDAIESALRQTIQDLEVVVCNDGSTDATGAILDRYYGRNFRVKVLHQENAGIGGASNAAVGASRGVYIGQLDSDDYLAEDVVERCLQEFDGSPEVGLVYTTYEQEYPDGRREPGYNYPVFNREKLLSGMIVHHFRMFRKRDWCRTEGFCERIENAVDYDMYLKLAEVCQVRHINFIGYRRRLRGSNTSIKKFETQNRNAAKVVNAALARMGLPFQAELVDTSSPKLRFRPARLR